MQITKMTLDFLIEITKYSKENNITIAEAQNELLKTINAIKPIGETCDFETYIMAINHAKRQIELSELKGENK